jgi:outer membrane protein TolC
MGIAFIAAIYAPPAPAQESTAIPAKLDVDRCVQIALKNHPNIAAYAGTVAVNENKVEEAKAGYYPQLDLSTAYSDSYYGSTGNNNTQGTLNQTSANYSAGVSLRQTIYDFGKTSLSVDIQKLNTDASAADLESVTRQVVFGVKQAYYGLLYAMRNRDNVTQAVRQYELRLTQAIALYESGAKPKVDVTKAQVDLSSARLNLIKAENALKLAKASLDNAMGITGDPQYSIGDDATYKKVEITLEEALVRAMENRTDFKSLALKRKSAEETVKLAQRGYYPTLNGSAGYTLSGERTPMDESWNVTATVTMPLFSGFSTKYQVEEYRASLSWAKANEEALRQSVELETRKAYASLKEAEEMIPVAELAARQARENLDLADARYSTGAGSSIEVADAQAARMSAVTAVNQALYDFKTAEASLEKAIGGR